MTASTSTICSVTTFVMLGKFSYSLIYEHSMFLQKTHHMINNYKGSKCSFSFARKHNKHTVCRWTV